MTNEQASTEAAAIATAWAAGDPDVVTLTPIVRREAFRALVKGADAATLLRIATTTPNTTDVANAFRATVA